MAESRPFVDFKAIKARVAIVDVLARYQVNLVRVMDGASFALGVRNSHSKQFRLSIVVGLRISVCSNLSFAGDFNIVLGKHSKNFLLKNAIAGSEDPARCDGQGGDAVRPVRRETPWLLASCR